jgi:hypothetical protein
MSGCFLCRRQAFSLSGLSPSGCHTVDNFNERTVFDTYIMVLATQWTRRLMEPDDGEERSDINGREDVLQKASTTKRDLEMDRK